MKKSTCGVTAYYNEFDKPTAQWLRNLVATGEISGGTIDDRPIQEVRPGDLAGYDRVHLFAGIGGWDYALKLAGWPETRPVWTGSCPCQPYSMAGRRKCQADPRDLWPEMFRLIREHRPGTIPLHDIFSPWISNANVSDGRGRGEILSQDDGKDISRVGIQS